MSAGKYINQFEKKQNRKKFMNQWKVFKEGFVDILNYCEDEYNDNFSSEKEQLDNLFEEKCIEREKSFNNEINDTFHANFDEIRKEFLDLYRGEIPDESLNWIYKVFGYIKTKC